MKCPKCHYLSFEPEPRCRNCGYDLELSGDDLGLALKKDEAAPLADLELNTGSRRRAPDTASDVLHPYGEVPDDVDPDPPHVDDPPVWAPVSRETSRAAAPAETQAGQDESEADAPVAVPVGSRAASARAALPDPDVDESGLPPIRRPAPAIAPRSTRVGSGAGGSGSSGSSGSSLPPERPRAPRGPGLPKSAEPRRPAPTTELPLFVKGLPPERDADEPLVRVPSAPTPPVSVHRRAPDSGRVRPQPPIARPAARGAEPPVAPRPQAKPAAPAQRATAAPPAAVDEPRRLDTFGRDLLQDLERLDREKPAARQAPRRAVVEDPDAVSPGTRLSAAVIDLGFLGTIALVVFWVTLRWCGLALADAASLPMIPVFAFVLMVVVGYLLLFTAAGGQTFGKMACGLRVADAQEDGYASEPVTPRQAFLRALLTVPSVLALGAGFVPALVGDGRAFHDRLTQTRVVRA